MKADNIEQMLENMFVKLGIDEKKIKTQALSYLHLYLKNQTFLKFTDAEKKSFYELLDRIKDFISPEGNSFEDPYSWLWDHQIKNVL